MSKGDTLRVVIYPEDEFIIAQGLELDICAWGKSEEEAFDNFSVLMRLEKGLREKDGGNLSDIGPAPDRFFDYWSDNNGQRMTTQVA